ncbi:MAG: hypothetical protein AB2A00_08495 [Myxococcota bacterium]
MARVVLVTPGITVLLASLLLALTTATEAPSVAVFTLQARNGVSEAAAEAFSEGIVVELRRLKVFSHVVSPRELSPLISPGERDALRNCALDECALFDADIAGGLGVSHVLAGSLSVVGASYIVVVKLLELRTGMATAGVLKRMTAGKEDAMLDAIPAVARELAVDAGLTPSAPLEEPSRRPSPIMPIAAGAGGAAVGVAVAVVLSSLAGAWSAALFTSPAFVHALAPLAPRTQPGHNAFLFGPPFLLGAASVVTLVATVSVVVISVAIAGWLALPV